MRSVLEGMGDGVVVVSEEGKFIVINDAARNLLGCGSAASLDDPAWTESFKPFFPDGTPVDAGADPFRQTLRDGATFRGELGLRRTGQSDGWIALTTHRVQLDGGATWAAVGVFRDVSAEHRANGESRAMVAKMAALIDHLSVGVAFEDATRHLQLVNRTFCKFFALQTPSSLIGHSGTSEPLIALIRDRDGFIRLHNRRMDEGIMVLADRVELTDGRVLERDYVPVTVEALINGHYWCYRDVTERERARAHLAELSNRDELTALYNRRGFITLAEQWLRIAARTKRTPMLLFVDVNGMKPINDRLGHASGDRVLRDTADLLRATFRESDILARLGGDEFVVLAVDATPEHSTLLCDRLQRNVEALNETADRPFRVSLSVGVAAWDPAQPRSIEELLAEADARMYEAKRRRISKGSIRVASGM